MSDSEPSQSIAEQGKKLANPEIMSKTQQQQSDAQSDTDDTDDSVLYDKSNEVLTGSDPLDNLVVDHEGGLSYSVLSVGERLTYYHVTLGSNPTCTCPDFEYNATDSVDICKHVVAAKFAPRLSIEESLVQIGIEQMSRMEGVVNDAEAVRDSLDEALTRQRERMAEEPSHGADDESNGGDTGSSSPNDQSTDEDYAHEEAEKLQSAFDEVIDEMQVTDEAGYVWVQMGKDTPETLPGPGSVKVFDALLKNADVVEYVHDDHHLSSSKPGEWWKNAIDPSDVDDYITEVLG